MTARDLAVACGGQADRQQGQKPGGGGLQSVWGGACVVCLEAGSRGRSLVAAVYSVCGGRHVWYA